MLPIRIDLPDNAQPKPLMHSDAATAHVERVLTIAEGQPSVPSDDEVATSWQRSANAHSIDPASGEPPRILTSNELKDLREPLAKLIVDAQDELDSLYKVVRQARYAILFCNNIGVAVDHRGNQTEADQFKQWGTWLGGVWSEEAEGTNGIGTCIVEERPVTIHQTQRRFLAFRSLRGGFRAPVSGRHFPISISVGQRPVRSLTETGSRSALGGIGRR